MQPIDEAILISFCSPFHQGGVSSNSMLLERGYMKTKCAKLCSQSGFYFMQNKNIKEELAWLVIQAQAGNSLVV